MSESAETRSLKQDDPWRDNEVARLRRLREDAKRPLGVNLAAGLALSEFLLSFKGIARGK